MNVNTTQPDAKRIFAENLKLARTMRALSMKALSERMRDKVSPAALSYYENGKRFPGSAHLLSIATALDVSPDFLLNPAVAPLDAASLSFRRLASTPVRVRDSLAARAQDALRRCREAMTLAGGDDSPVLPSVCDPITDEPSAERAAATLRNAWNLGVDPIKDVVDLLERNGILVLSLDMPECVSGFCGEWSGLRFVACNASHPPFRRRSTLVHEIAHLFFRCEDERLSQYFAGAFLLPAESFRRVWGPARRRCPAEVELLDMKQAFGASMASIVYRAAQLHLLPEPQLKGWFIRHPRKAREKGDDSAGFRETPSLFRSRVFALLQDERITFSKGAALLGESVVSLRNALAPA